MVPSRGSGTARHRGGGRRRIIGDGARDRSCAGGRGLCGDDAGARPRPARAGCCRSARGGGLARRRARPGGARARRLGHRRSARPARHRRQQCRRPAARQLESTPAEAWAEAFELSLNSAVRLARLALPHLRASGRGRIVNITSWSVREPIPNLMLSNADPPGVVGWAKTLSHELGPDGITVNTIAPGKIQTPRAGDLGAHARPRAGRSRDLQAIPARLGSPRGGGGRVPGAR